MAVKTLLVGYALAMQVRVLYFGVLKELLKRDGEQVELPAKASVGTLLETVRGVELESGAVWKSLAVAVNQEYADTEWALHEGDEVALLPPVSGGSGEAGPSTSSDAKCASDYAQDDTSFPDDEMGGRDED